jgi:integrase
MSVWDRSLRRVFASAGVKNGHAHRFRDTFAVELLLSGVPLDQVSILLGHSSMKVTEKHYAPWVKSRQDNLERLVQQSWKEAKLPANVVKFRSSRKR